MTTIRSHGRTPNIINVNLDAAKSRTVLTWLEALLYDLRFALRGLLRDRGFTFAAIVMLAVAIGLNVTVFTVMDAILFRGAPLVRGNDRLRVHSGALSVRPMLRLLSGF